MTNKISQIQSTYNPTEDRILLKIKTLNEQVYLAWMTRRFVKLLIPILHGQHPTTGKSLFDDKTTQILQLEKQQTQIAGDFETEYSDPDNAEYPLGERPLLLAKITFKDLKTQNGQLIFEPETGQGILLPYHADLLGPLIKVFSQALLTADWGIELEPILEMPSEIRLQ